MLNRRTVSGLFAFAIPFLKEAKGATMSDQFISHPETTLKSVRIGWKIYPLSVGKQALVKALIADNNTRTSPELPDELSPRLMNPEKTIALLERLVQLPKSKMDLQGKVLYISSSLYISNIEPVELEAFNTIDKVTLKDGQGDLAVDVEFKVPANLDKAKSNAIKLRTMVEQYTQEANRLRKVISSGHYTNEEFQTEGPFLRARWMLCHAWRMNAEPLMKAYPDNFDYKKDYQDAKSAVSRYIVNMGGGMPPE